MRAARAEVSKRDLLIYHTSTGIQQAPIISVRAFAHLKQRGIDNPYCSPRSLLCFPIEHHFSPAIRRVNSAESTKEFSAVRNFGILSEASVLVTGSKLIT